MTIPTYRKPVADEAVHPGEDSTLDRTWGGGKCLYNNATADELIKTGAGVLYGYIVTVATAANVIELRDAVAAGAGTVLISIPASTAVGIYALPAGVSFSTGLYADFTGTGTINVLYV